MYPTTSTETSIVDKGLTGPNVKYSLNARCKIPCQSKNQPGLNVIYNIIFQRVASINYPVAKIRTVKVNIDQYYDDYGVSHDQRLF